MNIKSKYENEKYLKLFFFLTRVNKLAHLLNSSY